MPLTLLQGPAGSGKTHHCLERLRQAQRAGQWDSALLLAPAQNVYSLRDALACPEQPVILGQPIRSFDAHKPWGTFGGWVMGEGNSVWDGLLERTGQLILLRRLLRGGVPDALAASARTLGFGVEMLRLIREWKESLVNPGQLREALESAPPSPMAGRSAALAEMYGRYQEALRDSSRLDAQDLEHQALAAIGSGDARLPSTHILVDGFSNFTRWQIEILEVLSRQAASLTVTFAYEPGRDWIFGPFEQERRLLTSLGGRPATIVDLKEQRRLRAPALVALERRIFEEQAEAASDAQGLELVEAADPVREIEEIARRIRAMVRGEGLAFDEIAVLLRDLASSRRRVAEIFEAHGIPHFLDGGEEQFHSAPARAARLLLALLRPDAQAGTVLSLLRSPLLAGPSDEADTLELEGRSRGLRLAAELLEAAPAILGPDAALCARARTLLERMGSTDVRAGEGWVRWLREGLEALGARPHAARGASNFMEFQAAWGELDRLLDAIAREETDPLSRPEMDSLLTEMLVAGTGSDVPRTTGMVLVGDIYRSRLPEVRAVFVPGLNEGQFPQRPGENPLFGDEERRKLAGRIKSRMPLAGSRLEEEYYLFYVGLTRASERLVLSHSCTDLSGGEARESVFFRETRKLFPQLTPGNPPLLESLMPLPLSLPELDRALSASLWRTAEDSPARAGLTQLLHARMARGESPWETPALTPELEVLKRAVVETNVSRLEKFAACPFQHFASAELHLDDRRALDFGAMEDGMILDAVVTAFLREVRSKGGLQALEGLAPAETALLAQLNLELKQGYAAQVARPLWKRRVPRLQAALRRFAAALWAQREQGEWEPEIFQWSFGRVAKLDDKQSIRERYVFKDERVELKIEGRADRVDRSLKSANEMRVLDYKRGGAGASAARMRDGRVLQTAVYGLALEEMLGKEVRSHGIYSFRDGSFQDLAAAYRRAVTKLLPPPAEKPAKLEGQEAVDAATAAAAAARLAARAALGATLGELGGRLAAGQMAVAPRPGACATCPYSSVCRIDPWRRLLSAAEDGQEGDDAENE